MINSTFKGRAAVAAVVSFYFISLGPGKTVFAQDNIKDTVRNKVHDTGNKVQDTVRDKVQDKIGDKPTTQSASDAEILATVIAANQTEIATGELAKTRATDERVKKFATHMVAEHTAAKKDAANLADKLKIKPVEDRTARNLKMDEKDTVEDLSKKKANDFDKAFVQEQVKSHERLLKTINDDLVPKAKQEKVKELLLAQASVVETHLAQAKDILKSIA